MFKCQLSVKEMLYTLLLNLKNTTYSNPGKKDESDLFLFSLITKAKENSVFNCTEHNVIKENHIV